MFYGSGGNDGDGADRGGGHPGDRCGGDGVARVQCVAYRHHQAARLVRAPAGMSLSRATALARQRGPYPGQGKGLLLFSNYKRLTEFERVPGADGVPALNSVPPRLYIPVLSP